MRVRAICVASARSNLAGTIEIECSERGLRITYVDAALVSEQGAPVPIDPGQRVTVEWSHVTDARVLGDAVAFDLEPAPWSSQKLLLVRFAAGRDLSPQRIRQRRLALRLWCLGLGLVSAVVLALALPHFVPEMGWRLAVTSGAALGLVVLAAGIAIDGLAADGGLGSRIVRELFIGELLGFRPNLPREPIPVTPRSVRWPRVEGMLPRATLAAALALLLPLLVTVALPGPIVLPSEAVEAGLDETAAVAAPATAAPAGASMLNAEVVGPCQCARTEGPLWGEPLPRVSVLVLSSRIYRRSGRDNVEVDLAAVNNGDRDLTELTTIVDFFGGSPTPWAKPPIVSRRPIYHAGPLGPGQAVKWRVDAEGSTVRVHPLAERGARILATIGPNGEDAAAPGAIAALLAAHNLPVRLHGAMLLALLEDPHARDAIGQLQKSLGEAGSAYLGRLLDAIGELRTCRIQMAGRGPWRRLSACIANTTDHPFPKVEMIWRALDKSVTLRDPTDTPPEVLSAWTLAVPGGVEPKAGAAVQVTVDLASFARPPAAFEAVARPVDTP